MDPISAVGLVGSIVSIADAVLQTANRLSLLQSKYRQADSSVSLLVGQIYTIQVALRQLAASREGGITSLASCGSKGLSGLSTSLDGCKLLTGSLNEKLNDLERQVDGKLSIKGKISLLWHDWEIRDYLDMLDRHVNALNLLLNVVQCTTSVRQQHILADDESKTILRLAREGTESLVVLDGSSMQSKHTSVFSEDTTDLSIEFAFDLDLMGTRAYHTAFKNNCRELVHGKSKSQFNGGKNSYAKHSDSPTIHGEPGNADKYLLQTTSPRRKVFPDNEVTRTFEAQDALNAAMGWNTNASRSQQSRHFSLLNFSFTRSHNKSFEPGRKSMITKSKSRGSLKPVNEEVKALLLGISEAGKSTFLKAIKLFTVEGYTITERELYRETVFSNMVNGMKALLNAFDRLPYPECDPVYEEHYKTVSLNTLQSEEVLLPEPIYRALKALWANKIVQNGYRNLKRDSQFSSLAYYLDEIDRIGAADYVPNDMDVLMTRATTTGIFDTKFIESSSNGNIWRVFDMGGERSERKKWYHVLKGADLIFFHVDVCCYNELLSENKFVNRMTESITVWDDIVNRRFLAKPAFVLIFTKIDQLASTIAAMQPHTVLGSVPEDVSPDEYRICLKDMFLGRMKDKSLIVKIIFENLTDDPNGFVFGAFATAKAAIQENRERKEPEAQEIGIALTSIPESETVSGYHHLDHSTHSEIV
ncbi:MAG: hypothetical protein Q9227_005762 [Pyrenula ochraceoflavens]